jgi:hypothetical protein
MNTRSLLVVLITCLLCACGGGGGGGNDGGVPPPSTTEGGTFTLGTNTANFNARSDGPSSQRISIPLTLIDARNVAGVGAAYVAPNQPQSWLNVGISGSGTSYTVDLDASSAGLAPGTYTAVVSIGTGKANGDILQRRDVTVRMIVTEITVLAEFGPFAFSNTLGHNVVSHAFTVHVDAPAGRTWTATATAPWIQVPATTYSGAADVPVVVSAIGLALNTHNGDLRFVSTANPDDNTVRPVSLTVTAPALTLFDTQITLGGEDGNGARTRGVRAMLDTGTNTYPLTVSAVTTTGGNWLAADAPASIGSSEIVLEMTATAAIGAPGHYDGAVEVQANVLGQVITRTLGVRYNQDQNKLVAGTLGVAFTKLPTRSVLSRSVRIHDSQDRGGIAWTATDDAAWLTVTPSGVSGGAVTLVADPTGLPSNELHYATVTISSASAMTDNEERIRVALKVGTVDPVTTSLTDVVVGTVANPVEPWVYLMGVDGSIQVRDVHSAALVDTFPAGDGEGSSLAVSDDGLTLFAIDGWTTQKVRVLDARTGDLLGEMPMERNNVSTLHYMRPNAHPVLITGNGEVFDVTTRTRLEEGLGLSTYFPSNKFAHSSDQRFLFSHTRAFSSGGIDKGRIAYSSLVTPRFVTEGLSISAPSGEGDADLCVSGDDSLVLAGSSRFYQSFNLLNASDLQIAQRVSAPSSAYGASTVGCLWNGLFMGSTDRDMLGTPNMYFFDAQGNILSSFLLYQADHEPLVDRIIVSGDASRVIAGTGGPSFHMTFYDAPLPP